MRRRLILDWARRASLVAAHASDLVLRDGAGGWLRGLRTATPALGTLCAVLLLAGVATLAAGAARHTLITELRQAAVVRVYLKHDAAAADVDQLRERLQRDRRVTTVDFVSADQALLQAVQRPGLARLAEAAGDNPFPARLEVHAAGLGEVRGIVMSLADEPAVDPAVPTSYDPGAYADLQRVLGVAGAIAVAAMSALALVAATVTANAVRASVLVRREDLTVMRLLGAGGWVLYGPFVVEGALTGAVAGLLAGAAVVALYAGAQQLSVRLYTELLPGVGWLAALAGAGLLPAVGAALGSLGALLGLRKGRT